MCRPTDCDGCAYSKPSALFHSGPRRECYQRFFMRHLPWNVFRRAYGRATMKLTMKRVQEAQDRKEVGHKGYTHTLTQHYVEDS